MTNESLYRALLPFAKATLTDTGQIIGLTRENFDNARIAIAEEEAARDAQGKGATAVSVSHVVLDEWGEAVDEAMRVCRGVNTCQTHRVLDGGLPDYVQTEEFYDWLKNEVMPTLATVLEQINQLKRGETVVPAQVSPQEVGREQSPAAH